MRGEEDMHAVLRQTNFNRRSGLARFTANRSAAAAGLIMISGYYVI